MTGVPRFQIRPGSSLDVRFWETSAAVFDSRSGDTHVVDVVAAQAMLALAESPLTMAELAAIVRGRLELPAGAAVGPYLDGLIRQLLDLGLIETRDS